jgi:hypothetical protein
MTGPTPTSTAPQSATASTLNVAINPAVGFRMPFANSGRVQILDNIINYTGLTSTSFTGCSLFAGSGGTLPDRCNVVGPATGGHGLVSAALTSVGALWTAGFRLQEHLTSFLTGGEDLKAMTIAPYWYQYDSADGQIEPDVVPPVGGLGFSHTLVSPAYAVQGQSAFQAKPSERAFYWHETGWQTWSASGTPSKEYLIPRLYGKMAAGAVDSGEICDTCLRMRWVG